MLEIIHNNEIIIRFGFFIGILMLMGLWEIVAPLRPLQVGKGYRWMNNLGLVVINTLLLRVLFPTVTVGMAVLAAERGWGVLTLVDWPLWLTVLASLVILDFMIWLQHVTVHAIPILWRLHRVHHADLDFDATTGLRFHPLEILLSMLIKFIVIIALGPPVLAVILFEIILNGMAMFNHGNVKLPKGLDRVLRYFVVTPDMHRVHHSVEDDETNSNFGFNLSCWDRLFGTYKDQPRLGHTGMQIGINGFREPGEVNNLMAMLVLPFKGRVNEYVINRRSFK